MIKHSLILGLSTAAMTASAQTGVTGLPELVVYSTQVAIQDPVGTFAMPISALRFEPIVDVQARNMAEGQADVTIRGGIFENTGFSVGAVSLYDAQTGHYFAEIPIAPAMLTAPKVFTGADNAIHGWNANAGTVAYQWRPIRNSGALRASAGEFGTRGGELYQAWLSEFQVAGHKLGIDASAAASESDGSRPYGESEFGRYNVRAQLQKDGHQTDLAYGYQRKYFGWPNLYVPFANVYETENIQTNLLVFNDRTELGDGDFVSFGAYYRRNKDNYVFNRATPGAYNPAFATGPAFHTTWGFGAGLDARITAGGLHWLFHAAHVDDRLKSTSLTWGPYRDRNHDKVTLAPEKSWTLSNNRTLTLKAGGSYYDTNRNDAQFAPLAQVSIDNAVPALGIQNVYVSYAHTEQTTTLLAINSRPTAGLFRGNPKLDWESAKNFEVGTRSTVGSWSIQTALFLRQDDDLVDWTYSLALPNARTANAVDIDTLGAEIVARYSSKSVDLVFGYTALTKDADYGSTAVTASFYALNYAKHRLTAAVIARVGKELEFRMDNEARVQKENALRSFTDETVLSSVGLYYSPTALCGLKLAIEVENLWGSDYQEVPSVPAAKRQLSFSTSYSW